MARVPYQDPRPTGEIAERIIARRGGDLTHLDRVLFNSPAMADGWNSLLGAVREESSLPDDVRELVIMRIASLNNAAYEWRAHAILGRKYGLDDAQIAYIRTGNGDSPLTPLQQTGFDFATEMTKTCRVSDNTYDAAARLLDARGIVDLTVTVAAYNMVSRFLTTLDVAEASTWNNDELEMWS